MGLQKQKSGIQMVQKQVNAIELGCTAMVQGRNIVSALGSIPQYAIKTNVVENLDRNYRNRNIYILSHSRATINALRNYRITML
jgi:hypothetical protein